MWRYEIVWVQRTEDNHGICCGKGFGYEDKLNRFIKKLEKDPDVIIINVWYNGDGKCVQYNVYDREMFNDFDRFKKVG